MNPQHGRQRRRYKQPGSRRSNQHLTRSRDCSPYCGIFCSVVDISFLGTTCPHEPAAFAIARKRRHPYSQYSVSTAQTWQPRMLHNNLHSIPSPTTTLYETSLQHCNPNRARQTPVTAHRRNQGRSTLEAQFSRKKRTKTKPAVKPRTNLSHLQIITILIPSKIE